MSKKLKILIGLLYFLIACGVVTDIIQAFAVEKHLEHARLEREQIENDIGFLDVKMQDQVQMLTYQLNQEKAENITRFAVIDSSLEIINSTIDADKKRWARIRKVQDAIKQTLPERNPLEGCRSKPTPSTIIQIATAVVDLSDRYGVRPALTLGIIRRESAFCNDAVSRAGARGLMQLMPATAADQVAEIGAPLKVYRIRDNIHLGVYYISKRLIDFEGDQDLALKAYNAGVNHVLKVRAGEIEEYYREPREYSRAVLAFKEEYLEMGVQ